MIDFGNREQRKQLWDEFKELSLKKEKSVEEIKIKKIGNS